MLHAHVGQPGRDAGLTPPEVPVDVPPPDPAVGDRRGHAISDPDERARLRHLSESVLVAHPLGECGCCGPSWPEQGLACPAFQCARALHRLACET